jgi:hypothetical protein
VAYRFYVYAEKKNNAKFFCDIDDASFVREKAFLY